jgi:hypothetical protein
MARFNNQLQEKEIDYLSAPLLLVKYKKITDIFLNNLLERLKENPDEKEDSFDDFIHMQGYTGVIHPTKKPIAKRPKKFTRQFYFHFPGKEGHYFEKMLAEMNRDNVTVILVGLPDYFGTFKTNFERRDFIFDQKRWQEEFKNVVFLNYNRSFKFPLRKIEYFLDGAYGLSNSHLSKIGARAFNKILMQDLKNYYNSHQGLKKNVPVNSEPRK